MAPARARNVPRCRARSSCPTRQRRAHSATAQRRPWRQRARCRRSNLVTRSAESTARTSRLQTSGAEPLSSPSAMIVVGGAIGHGEDRHHKRDNPAYQSPTKEEIQKQDPHRVVRVPNRRNDRRKEIKTDAKE